MKLLVEKEIRLVLPAFVGALALAILPVWLFPVDRNPGMFPGFLFWFGIVILALSSFGRELALRTLPFILAQPLGRARIWWTKIAVLAVCVVLAFDGWWLSGSLCSSFKPVRFVTPEALAFSGLIVVVFTVGALWMTLLLRQVTAAFWLTILIPMSVPIPAKAMGAPDGLIYAGLGLYAVAAFFLARRQFLHFQDTAWTGGVLSFGSARAGEERGISRERRPWAALFAKELQLQQITLVGIGCLLALHLGVVVLRKVGANMLGHTILSALEFFGGLWLIVPFLAGSQSVADERHLGTLDALLCLPFSRRLQFAVKIIFVLVIGGLLSATLLCAVERLGSAMGAGAGMGIWFDLRRDGFHAVFVVFLVLSLLGFYGSTLTRGMVPALATGAVVALALWGLQFIIAVHLTLAVGRQLWPLVAFPTLTVALIWLAYGNFRYVFESGRRWRRNILGLITVIVIVFGALAAIYHRVWELAMPLEGPHGPARLPTGRQVLLDGCDSISLAAVLPDGRLWQDSAFYQAGNHGAHGSHFVPGSNWVAASAMNSETVGIRSDGTLWVSKNPHRPWQQDGAIPSPLVQFGADTDWQSLASDNMSSLVLLKKDGTLWSWGTNYYDEKQYQGLRAVTPHRLGTESDWARVFRGSTRFYAWKRDGNAWTLEHSKPVNDTKSDNASFHAELLSTGPAPVRLDGGTVARRLPALDHVQFKSLNSYWTRSRIEAGVRDDGTLWCWDWMLDFHPAALHQRKVPPAKRAAAQGLVQIGKDSDWVAITGGFFRFAALKTDGSMWLWKFDPEQQLFKGFSNAPVRMGTHNDWVAVGSSEGEIVALAADGTLWRWQRSDLPSAPWMYENTLLAPSRRPTKIENIFDAQE